MKKMEIITINLSVEVEVVDEDDKNSARRVLHEVAKKSIEEFKEEYGLIGGVK